MKLFRFYTPKEQAGLADPKPAKAFIPQWYKEAETFYDFYGEKTAGLKTCMPYLDALIAGYILSTPIDIYVNEHQNEFSHLFNSEELQIRWNGPPSLHDFISERPKESGATMPRPAGHYPNHLVFKGYWSYKTPRGWSTLVTSPLNRDDLPFTIASGIIDTDKFGTPGNLPFFIKKGITGLIPKGTPIAQMIPLKRASWTMVDNDAGISDGIKFQSDSVGQRNSKGSYKKKYWQRKSYG